MNELVSIIIPAYQEEKRIGRCLKSILASSYKNLELIVVNDGSTDRTEEIVRQFMERTKEGEPIIRLVSIPNGGLAHARNVGLCNSRGQFIGFADADDMIHPQMIERLVMSLQRGNDLAACGLLICDEDGKPFKWQYKLRRQHRQCPVQALDMVMWEQILMSVSPALFVREKIVDECGGLRICFPENVSDFEDFAFVCKYICLCNRSLEVQPFHGVYYCKHKGSLTTKTYTARELHQSLQPILDIGKQIDKDDFVSWKYQYAFRFVAFWYEEAFRCKKEDFTTECQNRIICQQEMERYASIFMSSSKVALYKKIAMWIARKCPNIGWMLAKTVGRMIFKDGYKERIGTFLFSNSSCL